MAMLFVQATSQYAHSQEMRAEVCLAQTLQLHVHTSDLLHQASDKSCPDLLSSRKACPDLDATLALR